MTAAAHLGWGPLRDVRVVEFGHFVAAPYSTLQLALYGAEVIKIESTARPDMWRLREGEADLHASVPFADHNKNKLSVTLDLKEPAAREAVLDLVAHSDAVVENFSYGVLERLGLGYDELAARRPDLVMVSLQGFGRSGPLRDAVALGPSLMACSGMTSLWSDDVHDPVGSQTSYPDYIVGLQAAFVLVSALRERERTGAGRYVEFAQFDAVLGLIGPALALAAAGGDPGRATLGPPAPSGVYRCAGEDRWCAVEVWTAQHRAGLDRAVPGLAGRAADDVPALLGSWTAERAAADVMRVLQQHGVPAGVVNDGRDLTLDPQLRARGFATGTGHPVLGDVALPGLPVRHTGSGGPRITRHAPLLGQDRDDVLSRVLGLAPDEIAALPA
ncbi:hypothetical protein PSU4_20970 [Pseudonocardia sulfidoxydans NBRC 16205]|uniref:CoA transferase n=1 Tax=Pseudonocardia sulfidoxydans NBRC 16205 TaxID=1223511 RepID=A0A511DFF6_9PSEU|nr:CoA transferase [Pseudonocardia sulfidoxydans]GEL23143.1 hypothetical protein PSU4_20970 [Pseudonocardia sulfidoxydans NBRC 16205]